MEAVLGIMQGKRVEVGDREGVDSKIKKIIEDGPERLQFIVDFDYTI